MTWTVTGSRTIVADRWIDLRADRCVTPNGAVLDPFYVLSYPDIVHVVAITEDERLVLVRQYRHGGGRPFLEIPSGLVDADDPSPEATALRELREETGHSARSLVPVASHWLNPATHTNRVHTYLALGAAETGGRHLEEGEDGMTVCFMPIEQARALLGAGDIPIAQVASILMALDARHGSGRGPE